MSNQFDSDTLTAAQAAYNVDINHPNETVTAPVGWRWDRNIIDRTSSFQVAVFVRPLPDGTTEHMYAIAGTGSGRDVMVDTRLGREQARSRPFLDMVAEATRQARDQGVTITFAGHSLGGGLASIAAYHVQHALENSERDSETQPGPVRMRSWNGFGTVEYFEAFKDEPGGIPFNPSIAGRIDAIAYRTDADLVSRIGTHWAPLRSISSGLGEIGMGRFIRDFSRGLPFLLAEEVAVAHLASTLKELVGEDGSGLAGAAVEDASAVQRVLFGDPLVDAIRSGDPFELDDPERTAPGARRETEPDRETEEAGTDSRPGTQESARPAALDLSTRTNLSSPLAAGEIQAGAGETVFSVADKLARKLGRTVTAAEIRALNALQASASNGFREGEAVRVPGPDGAGPGRGPGDVELGAGARVRDLGESQAKLLEKKLGRSLREIDRDPAVKRRAKALFRDGFVKPSGADGLPKALGRRLARLSAGHGPKAAARTLQQAANRLGAGLRVDGVAGPRTRTATGNLLRRVGEGALEEAMGLSRFRNLAAGLARGPADPDSPGRAFDMSLGKLFPRRRASKPREEVRVLQEATNDASRFAGLKPDLRIDGILGPRTAAAMTDAIRAKGADDFTDDLADRFGFLETAAARRKPVPGLQPKGF